MTYTKHNLWQEWKAQGVSRDQARDLFHHYETVHDVDVWLSRLIGMPFSLGSRIKIMYALRKYDLATRKA